MSSTKAKGKISTVLDTLTESLQISTKEGNQISEKKDDEDISVNMLLEKEQISPFLPTYVKSFSKTWIESTTFDYLWKIEHFKRFSETIDTLNSPKFPENGQYCIQMNITRKPNLLLSTVQFYIRTNKAFTGSCTITIMHLSETILPLKLISGRIRDMTLLAEILNFTQINTDTLTIHCKFDIFHKLITNAIHMNLLPPTVARLEGVKSIKDSILDELELKNGKSIKFTVGTEQHVVSKKLLWATNSSYFKNICLTHEKEKEMTSELTTNSELQAFKQLLLFIITGSIKYPYYNMLKELLTTAIKYDVLTLKLTCEHYLLRCISVENALELIKLAFSSNAKFLETHSATFIKFHMKEIVEIKEFQDLRQEDLNKIMELMEKSEILETSTHHFFSSSPTKKFISTYI